MVSVALGTTPALACPVGDSNLDEAITVDEITGAIRDALSGCSLRRSFDFRSGRQGWEPRFADYSPEMLESLALDSGPRILPSELGLEGSGFLLSGSNQSDDLFMSLHRQLTAADGVEPGQTYSVEYSIVVASSAPSGCSGIGGAPGESVFLKAGASNVAPETAVDPIENLVRLNVDKGEQAEGGRDASVVGNIANGLECDPGNEMFVSLRREHVHTSVTASAAGDVWLLIGTDSGYEGTTTLYYQRIDVRLTPVEDLQLNDVSILFPLPAADELDLLLAPTDAGGRGPLLPPERYGGVPKLHVFQTPEQTYDLLRVVAMRLDPCFVTGPQCRRQIRLTMQPIAVDPIEELTRGDDASLHLFYDLSESEFASLLSDLRQAKRAASMSTSGPLRVHPILASEGLGGPFAAELRRTVLAHVGGDNLSRITFMQLQNFNLNEWMFGGFNVVGGELVPIQIIDANSTRQRFINVFLDSEQDFVASVEPRPLGEDDISLLFNSNRARAAALQEIAAAERAALRIENPDVHSSETVSCVACHTATQTRLWTERSLGRTTDQHPDRFAADADLSLTTETALIPGSLRAFGYFHRKVAISQRTVNESAAVVAQLAEAADR